MMTPSPPAPPGTNDQLSPIRSSRPALCKAIYIDEDHDVRVGYPPPHDGLSLSGLHADALRLAAEAKKMGQV